MADNEEIKDQNPSADDAKGTDATDNDVAPGVEDTPVKSKSMLLILAIALPVVLGLGAGAAYFLFSGSDATVQTATSDQAAKVAKQAAATEPRQIKKTHYFALEPTLLVRIKSDDNQSHHARIDVAIMTRDAELVGQLKQHTPILRNNLIDVIQTASYNELTSIQGKKALRNKALETVKQSTKELLGNDNIDAVLFTNYLVE